MSDYEKLNRALRQEISAITPNRVDDLLARLGEQPSGVSEPIAARARHAVRRQLIAAVLALVLLGGGAFYGVKHAQRSVVILDADAPVAFTVDGFDRVCSVRLENARAVSVVDAEQCNGKRLDAAVANVTEQWIAGDVLSPEDNAVLVSVQEDSAKRADALTKSANDALAKTAASHEIAVAVLLQTVPERISAAEGVSLGRSALVEKLGAGITDGERDALLHASVNDLLYFAKARELVLSGVTVLGTRNDAVYCTKEQAIDAARAAAGGSAASSAVLKWQTDELVYAVTMQTERGEASYTVSARTGEILDCVLPDQSAPVPVESVVTPGVLPTDLEKSGPGPNLPPIADLPSIPETPVDPGLLGRAIRFWEAIV